MRVNIRWAQILTPITRLLSRITWQSHRAAIKRNVRLIRLAINWSARLLSAPKNFNKKLSALMNAVLIKFSERELSVIISAIWFDTVGFQCKSTETAFLHPLIFNFRSNPDSIITDWWRHWKSYDVRPVEWLEKKPSILRWLSRAVAETVQEIKRIVARNEATHTQIHGARVSAHSIYTMREAYRPP